LGLVNVNFSPLLFPICTTKKKKKLIVSQYLFVPSHFGRLWSPGS
jgi:hypothetical protein